MNDQTIVEALQADEERGYALLMDGYMRYVVRILAGMAKGGLRAEDLEELAADVFFKVWRQRDRLRPETLKAYVAQTARNAAIDCLRGKKIEWIPYEDDILAFAGSSPDELAEVREQGEILTRAVNEFGEPDREIFVRFYYYGEALKAIAAQLNLNAATVKTKLHRARGRLRELLTQRGYDCE